MDSPISDGFIKPLPQMVDDIAEAQPDTTWISIPFSNNIDEGYHDISFARLARVVNKMARWIERNVGISDNRETLAYMGVNDTRYIVTILAALKTGYKVLLTSTRNSIEGQRSLMQSTDCSKFLHTSELATQVGSINDENVTIKPIQIPDFDDLLHQETDAEHYEGRASNDPDEPAIVIHTSGSTGIPKPMLLRNGYLATIYRLEEIPTPGDRLTMAKKLFDHRPIYCGLPWFHAMGLFMMLRSLYNRGPLILPPSSIAPNADQILKMLQLAKPRHAFFPPSVLEDMVDTPGGLEVLGTLEDVYFAGAPLSHEVGDRVAKLPNTKLQTVIGSTEAGIIDSFVTHDKLDWDFFEWAPYSGAVMEPAGQDLCELVLKPLHNNLQGAFFTFPASQEWRTKDLYEPHPKKSGLWRYKGRNDDVIVLSNGEKFGPVDQEKTVEGHPAVKGALVVGQGRFQAGLIIEPDLTHAGKKVDPDILIDEIWPTVEKANRTVAAHGRVFKSKIAIASQDKPFARAPKGSIMRRQTNSLYEKEIEALYSNEAYADQIPKLSPECTNAEIKNVVQKALGLALPNVSTEIKDTDDIFSFGIDSLAILGLSTALNHAMPEKESVIKPRAIYANPTVNGLVEAIASILHGESKRSSAKSREQTMSDMIAKYAKLLPARIEQTPAPQKHVVALTGSTGSLGTYILQQLIADDRVGKIYCLNRTADAASRQKKSFEFDSMNPDFGKVEFLKVSMGKETFDLPEDKYQDLKDTVDIFIHNAWAVDFNMSLDSFEDTHIAGVQQCIEFSASSKYHSQIVFISSIASVGNWFGSGNSGFVPETSLTDVSVALPQGYGESKHVSANILAAAAEKSGIPATVIRVGQLAGPITEKGIWNRQEWLPSIISSSKAIGKVPRNLGNMDTVDWVPVDVAAKVTVELALSRASSTVDEKTSDSALAFYHLVNPKTVSWQRLAPIVQAELSETGTKVEAVDFKDWLAALEELPMTKENAERIPGLKLLDFYEGIAGSHGLPRLATETTAAASSTLRNLGPVNEDMMKTWMDQWSL